MFCSHINLPVHLVIFHAFFLKVHFFLLIYCLSFRIVYFKGINKSKWTFIMYFYKKKEFWAILVSDLLIFGDQIFSVIRMKIEKYKCFGLKQLFFLSGYAYSNCTINRTAMWITYVPLNLFQETLFYEMERITTKFFFLWCNNQMIKATFFKEAIIITSQCSFNLFWSDPNSHSQTPLRC